MSKLRVDKIAAPIVKDEFTGSVYFDGTGDYLSVADSSDFAFGTEDFTIEFWRYRSSVSDTESYVTKYNNTNAQQSFWFGALSSGREDFAWYSGSNGYSIVSANNVAQVDEWGHLAAVRLNGVITLYLNGVSIGSDSSSDAAASFNDDSNPLRIGGDNYSDSTYDYHGYISNLRVCKGHAVYQGNFTPPTRELPVHTKPPKGFVFPAIDNVTVLLACQSSTDATLDSSGRHTITAAGDATAADANPGLLRKTNIFSKYSEDTGSVFFDGISDTLGIVENGNDFDYDADFSIEFWVYFNELKSYQDIAGTSTNSVFLGSNKSGWVASYYTSGTDQFRFSYQDDSSWTFQHAFNFAASTNTWYHVAYQRHDGSIKLYVNGSQIGSTYSTSTNLISTENRLLVGSGHGVSPGSTAHFHGYLSNLRICKGHAVYKSNFTPPTKELDVHPQSVLLACHDGENIFADKTGRHIIAAYGDRVSGFGTAAQSPIGITTFQPGLIRDVDPTAGPTFQGGVGYNSQNWLTLPKGTTVDRNRTGGRGLIMGGYDGNSVNSIEFITISSLGNAQDFGDLTSARFGGGSCGSSTRGLYGGGEPSKTPNDYVTIASTGNSVSFGSLDSGSGYVKACSNQTRGVWGGGRNPNSTSLNVIQYVTIATLGNSQDFGILTSKRTGLAAFSSPTRGIFSGGYTHPSPTTIATLDYITIAATGNALDFGDLLTNVKYSDAVSSGTRGAIAGGGNPNTNVIQYVTISTLGDAIDFGDLITAREHLSGTDNSIRGVFIGGVTPTILNTIDYMTIASTGNAADFGDLSQKIGYSGGTSDSHGGLG